MDKRKELSERFNLGLGSRTALWSLEHRRGQVDPIIYSRNALSLGRLPDLCVCVHKARGEKRVKI